MARITYHSPGKPMDLTTYGDALPRPAVEWLFEWSDEALAWPVSPTQTAPKPIGNFQSRPPEAGKLPRVLCVGR